jgi:hypothetical protein
MPEKRIHKKLWKSYFGDSFPEVEVDSAMDRYSRKVPGIKHREKEHDPLRTGECEGESSPELDKYRIMYRLFHIAVDWWWTGLPREIRSIWSKKINKGIKPPEVWNYFWYLIELLVHHPLEISKVLPWEPELLPPGWEEYIKKSNEIKLKNSFYKSQ